MRSSRALTARSTHLSLPTLALALALAAPATGCKKHEAPPPDGPLNVEEPPDPSDRVNAKLAFRGVRVFDGERVLEDTTVLVGDNGLILDVGPSEQVGVPDGAELIEGMGYTLLPGLIDAHTHTMTRAALQQAAVFGVTTELDMFTNHEWAAQTREREAAGKRPDAADLRSAGTLATAPGGHGTEYGVEIPTISGAEEAAAFVAARVEEGSDYIKIVYDDGAAFGVEFPTLDKPTLTALIDAAHAQRRLAIVHIGSQQGAIDALQAGADGLAHIFFDQAPTPEFITAATQAEGGPAFVTDTLAVCHALRGAEFGAGLAADARLKPMLTPTELRALTMTRPAPAKELPINCEHGAAAVKALHDAGVPVLASTDVPNGGMLHGVSLHGELELLVKAGLSTTDALIAATSAPAAAFGLEDRGRIATGKRADLVLVEGDPTADITATRAIVSVYKQGSAIDRAAYQVKIRQQLAAIENQKRAPSPAGAGPGLISDFDDGTQGAAFGAGWQASTDALRGGKSTATLTVSRGGAKRSKHALDITGVVDPGLGAMAWAGAMFSPGAAPMQPANLRGHTQISFWARGDTGSVVVMAFATQLGMMPARVEVPLEGGGKRWKQYTVTFEELGIEPYDLMGLYFGAPPKPGPFTLRLDDVRLEPAIEEAAATEKPSS